MSRILERFPGDAIDTAVILSQLDHVVREWTNGRFEDARDHFLDVDHRLPRVVDETTAPRVTALALELRSANPRDPDWRRALDDLVVLLTSTTAASRTSSETRREHVEHAVRPNDGG